MSQADHLHRPICSTGWIPILGLAVLAACGQALESDSSGPAVVPVRIAAVARTTVPEVVEAAADVLAENRTVLAPEVGGLVESIEVRQGDQVTKGQVLVRIADRDYRNTLVQAEAALAAAEAQKIGADQAFETAAAQFERMKELRRTDSISQGAFDEVQARYEQARAAKRSTEAQVRSARAQLGLAQEALEDTELRAPFDGYVAQRLVDAGSVLQTMPPTSGR